MEAMRCKHASVSASKAGRVALCCALVLLEEIKSPKYVQSGGLDLHSCSGMSVQYHWSVQTHPLHLGGQGGVGPARSGFTSISSAYLIDGYFKVGF